MRKKYLHPKDMKFYDMEPEDVDLFRKADKLIKKKQYKKAKEIYLHLFKKYPRFPVYDISDDALLNNFANTLNKLEEHDKELEIRKFLLDKSPNDYTYNLNIGVCYIDLENYDGAVYYLKKAHKIKPDFITYLNLGVVYEELNDKEKALKFYNEGLSKGIGDSLDIKSLREAKEELIRTYKCPICKENFVIDKKDKKKLDKKGEIKEKCPFCKKKVIVKNETQKIP